MQFCKDELSRRVEVYDLSAVRVSCKGVGTVLGLAQPGVRVVWVRAQLSGGRVGGLCSYSGDDGRHGKCRRGRSD